MLLANIRMWGSSFHPVFLGTLCTLSSCIESPDISINPNHCSAQAESLEINSDQWCSNEHDSERQFCSLCVSTSNGCTNSPPPSECQPAGASPSGTTTTSSGSSTSSETEASDTAQNCGEDSLKSDECSNIDPNTPICYGGNCVSCNNEICANLVEDKAICAPGGTSCVECTPWDESKCTNSSPFCDSRYQCGGCTRHEQCDSGACDLASGTCMNPDNIWWVNNSPDCASASSAGTQAAPYCTLDEALSAADNATGSGGSGAIMLLGEGDPYEHLNLSESNIDMVPGKNIDFNLAIIGQYGNHRFQSTATSGYVIETQPNVHLYLENISITDSERPGIRCLASENSGLWLDDVVITRIGSAAGSGATVFSNGCHTTIRHSRIYNNGKPGIHAQNGSSLEVTSSFLAGNTGANIQLNDSTTTFEISHSTIIAANAELETIQCEDSSGTVQNSVLLDPTENDPDCSTTSLDEPDDFGNVTNSNIGIEMNPATLESLFSAIEHGDLHLSDEGRMTFRDRATWTLGDSLYDIDGERRPGIDGGTTYPGADE